MGVRKQLIASLLAVTMTLGSILTPMFTVHADEPAADYLWQAVAFGQSTDMDFSSTMLPEKIGTNYVYPYDADTNLAEAEPLPTQEPASVQDVAMEARGGKISAAHDGLTFYYTEIPTDKNFILTGTIRVEQMGPESAAPNLQEGVGLMVRDVIGGARQNPLWEGYEEYPAASNVAGIWVDAASKNIDADLTIKYMARYGVDAKEGTNTSKFVSGTTNWLNGLPIARATSSNAGSSIPDQEIAELTSTNRYEAEMTLQLERTNETFIMRMLDENGNVVNGKVVNFKEKNNNINSNIVENIEKDVMYVGFFASRNARASVRDIQLTVSDANTIDYPQYVPINGESAALFQASGNYSNSENYEVRGITNYDGTVTIKQVNGSQEVELGTVDVIAGVQFTYAVELEAATTKFKLIFEADRAIVTTGDTIAELEFEVEKQNYPEDLYVSTSGTAGAAGTKEAPMDMATAIEKLVPGGTIYVAAGTYGQVEINMENSGSEEQRKSLIAQGDVIIKDTREYLFALNADYWNVDGFEVDGEDRSGSRGLYIYGSHNVISNCDVHNTSSDAGICITGSGRGRAAHRSLWPSYNLVKNCQSYNHVDTARINADGFAAKSQSGDYNIFRSCVAYGNADDGWDLFNKLAEGANGTTIIENCIAFNNGNNGFKLGGESLPVQHEIRNSIAYNNGLDGFTDNFNPGNLIVENNTSFDNQRFNYIFRPSPYILDQNNEMTANGTKINNVSFRTEIIEDTYSDRVYGATVENNFFVEGGDQPLTAADFVSLDKSKAYTYKDGEIIFGDFLRLKADSIAALAGAGAHAATDEEYKSAIDILDEFLKNNKDAWHSYEEVKKQAVLTQLLEEISTKQLVINAEDSKSIEIITDFETLMEDLYDKASFIKIDSEFSDLQNIEVTGVLLNAFLKQMQIAPIELKAGQIPELAADVEEFELKNQHVMELAFQTTGRTTFTDLEASLIITVDIPTGINKADAVVLMYSKDGKSVTVLSHKIEGERLTFVTNNLGIVVIGSEEDGSITNPSRKSSKSGSTSTNGKGWSLDENGWKYQRVNGSYPTGEWLRYNGLWYYFNDTGYMMTGWVTISGKTYYLQPQGHMVENDWVLDVGKWYYLTADGSRAEHQWIEYKDNSYYLGADGGMIKDSTTPDGLRVDSEGRRVN